MDLITETLTLEKAERDIDAAKVRIDRQKEIVGMLGPSGPQYETAALLLQTFQEALGALEAHHKLILERVEQLRNDA
ncbi:hypothetical protein AWB78_05795 [Caballeronia calidae]|uniref:Uncharacterized protein n=1 Tax=Caballeronia calidae TaxID=1777139 RepID=A0A158DZA4_9BURK|nr:hypothetical protein [Caballeronia calidae]SAK99536.1 hypothetical protein AWB78_05795 [Caballeronia calidae]